MLVPHYLILSNSSSS